MPRRRQRDGQGATDKASYASNQNSHAARVQRHTQLLPGLAPLVGLLRVGVDGMGTPDLIGSLAALAGGGGRFSRCAYSVHTC